MLGETEMMTREAREAKEDLKMEMFHSLVNLMNNARIDKDKEMLEVYARLVHETWTAIVHGEDDE